MAWYPVDGMRSPGVLMRYAEVLWLHWHGSMASPLAASRWLSLYAAGGAHARAHDIRNIWHQNLFWLGTVTHAISCSGWLTSTSVVPDTDDVSWKHIVLISFWSSLFLCSENCSFCLWLLFSLINLLISSFKHLSDSVTFERDVVKLFIFSDKDLTWRGKMRHVSQVHAPT